MTLCSPVSIESTSNSLIDHHHDDDDDTDCDDQNFKEVVFEFIERIGKEVSFYENYEPNIAANDFKHIELQIQAKRVAKVLELCVRKIGLVFILSHFIKHQNDHLILYFSNDNANLIKLFSEKWHHGTTDNAMIYEFDMDLNRCLDIIDGSQIKTEKFTVIDWNSRRIFLINSLLLSKQFIKLNLKKRVFGHSRFQKVVKIFYGF